MSAPLLCLSWLSTKTLGLDRTVRLFEEAGILERHDFRDGRSRYEEAPEQHHDHLIDVSTGGGSDGNFTAPFTGTLDGLGVDGEGAHTHYEQLYISSLTPRAQLLYRLYQTLV